MSTPYARYKLPTSIGKALSIFLYPSYVSNGHWAVAKARLTNAPLFADETSVKAYLKGKPDIRTKKVHGEQVCTGSRQDGVSYLPVRGHWRPCSV